MRRDLVSDLAGLIGGVADPWQPAAAAIAEAVRAEVVLLSVPGAPPRRLAVVGVAPMSDDGTEDRESLVRTLRTAGCREIVTRELVWEGRLIGTLAMGTRQPEGLSRHTEEVLGRIETILALGLAAHLARAERDRERERRRQLEQRMAELERMVTVGLVAAAVAHDLAAPVQGLSMLGEDFQHRVAELERILPDMSPHVKRVLEGMRHLTDDVREDSVRARALLNDFRIAAGMRRGDAPAPGPVSVQDALRSAVRLVTPLARHLARVDIEVPEGLPRVMGIRRRLDQAFTNLLMNAVQAASIRGAEAGRVVVKGSMREGRVVLDFIDNGPGVDPAIRDRIFEPFFTTKPPEEGTGLGLHIVKEIIDAHKGSLEVDSAPGRGACFRVVLPAAPVETPVSEKPRVLVVDADARVARAFQRMLSRENEVVVSTSAEAALALLLKEGARFHAMVVDVDLPGMDGRAFYDRLRNECPGLEERIIFSSIGGHSREVGEFLRSVRNPCFEKPVAVNELGSLVRKVTHAA